MRECRSISGAIDPFPEIGGLGSPGLFPGVPSVYYTYYSEGMTTVRLDEETEKRLDRLARKTGRTKSFYLRKALEEHLEDIEDYYLGMLALENTERTYTGEEAKRELGLRD